MNKKIYMDQEKEICSLYNDGKTTKELTKIYLVCDETILKCLKRNNVKLKKYKHTLEARKNISKTAKSNLRVGIKSNTWKGGRNIDTRGYMRVYAPNHPNKIAGNYVMEHRSVMEKDIGRYLTKEEIVHHINGNKLDNRIENLQLMTPSEHTSHHHKGFKHSEKSKQLMSKNLSIYKHLQTQFIELYLVNKLSIKEISDKLHISPMTIRKYLKNNNIKFRKKMPWNTGLKGYTNAGSFKKGCDPRRIRSKLGSGT